MSRLQVEIKKITGFQRLSPGSTFEVTVTHDLEIVKCKGKIQNDKTQIWNKPNFTMLCYPQYNIEVKIKELKLFGSTTLAVTTIPIIVFYKKSTRIFMLSLNSTGTLKLEFKITLNPLPDPNFQLRGSKKQTNIFNRKKSKKNVARMYSYNFSKSPFLQVVKSKLNFSCKRKAINDDKIVRYEFRQSSTVFDDGYYEL